MNPFVMAGMIGLSGTSLCCLAGTEHRRLKRTWAAPVVMVAAMVLQAIPGVSNGFMLVAAALLLVTLPLSVARPVQQVSASAMQVHRALSALLMAVVIFVGLGLSSTAAGATASMGGMPGMGMAGSTVGGGGGIEVVLDAAAVAYLIFSAWTARASLRTRTRAGVFAAAEVATMAIAMVVMAVVA